MEEHVHHDKQVLNRLEHAGLQIDIKKCEFHIQLVKFLGLIITTEGIKMDPVKYYAIESWPTPENSKEISRLLGFTNFYRRYIPGFGSIVMLLTDCLEKDTIFSWGDKQIFAFKLIKQKFR